MVDVWCVCFVGEAESIFEQHCLPVASFDNCISDCTIYVHEIQWHLG